ncbi:hypothetical protein [Propionivibrio sp.]|uniref:hypothetical protein n=1 Tax=Propionivibrio sp. TaxID=2212460 RepID=UPI003BF36916
MTLFASKTQIVAELRADRLILAGGTYFNTSDITDDYLYSKLIAAEADAARRLRVLLEPTTVFAGEPTDAEITAVGTSPWIEEAAYDYEPELWNTEDWGYLVLRNKLVSKITSLEFVYPAPVAGSFLMPPSWIRLDKKAGHLRFVPGGSSMSVGAFSTMILSMMAGGRHVPQMIRVRYTAGMANAARDYPDLIDLIKKMAVLRIINDAFVPQSGSISADGLSQSFSADVDKFSSGVDSMLGTLRDSLQGVRCMVM